MQVKGPTPDPPPEREILIRGTQDEDDFNPYTVRGELLTAKCPECGQALTERAKICVHCGCDLAARSLSERVFEPVAKEWDNGWQLRTRLGVFALLQTVNLAMVIAGTLTGSSALAAIASWLVLAALQALVLGTFDRVGLTRNARGKVALTRTWRVCFLARPPQRISWQEHESVRSVMADEFDALAWTLAAVLLLYAILPGVLFW